MVHSGEILFLSVLAFLCGKWAFLFAFFLYG